MWAHVINGLFFLSISVFLLQILVVADSIYFVTLQRILERSTLQTTSLRGSAALTGVAQWVEHWSASRRGHGFDPRSRAGTWVAGLVPGPGQDARGRQPTHVFLLYRYFSPSPPPPTLPSTLLKKINQQKTKSFPKKEMWVSI